MPQNGIFASPLFKAGAKGGCAAGANELPDKWQFVGERGKACEKACGENLIKFTDFY